MERRTLSGPKRLLVVLGLMLLGTALIPYVALPYERFGWQLFAGIYGSGPQLAINYETGAPGSSFSITGVGFPANQQVSVQVNGQTLGTATTDDIGGFLIQIISAPTNNTGYYAVLISVAPDDNRASLAAGESAGTAFVLRADAPLRAREGEATAFNLPDGLAQQRLYLPLIKR
jgi:hypothetical protein